MTAKNIGTRETLLSSKPKLTEFEFEGNRYYIRELTVGDVNRELFEFRQWLISQAEEQGIELDYKNETTLEKQLEQIGNQYRIPRNLANRLCDEKGVKLFDPTNVDDLNLIARLSDSLLAKFNEAAGLLPKNSPPDASSN